MLSGQYIRLEALIGTQKLEKLQNKRVAIIGCGAVGGFALEAISRCGIKHITVVDKDRFELSNLNRQLLALHSTIGQEKTKVAMSRILDINPECCVNEMPIFLDESNASEIIKGHDLILDCIDSVRSKAILLKTCLEENIPVISSMGAALKTDITKLMYADISKTYACPLAKSVRTELKKYNIYKGVLCVFSSEAPKRDPENTSMLGSMPTITATFGLMVAHKGIEYLLAELD